MLLDQFKRTKQKAYPIIRTEPVSAISDVKQYMGRNGDKFDLVFFDLPGTLNADGVIRTVAAMEHLFIPIKADRIVVESAIMFAKVIHEQLMRQGKSNIKTIGLFWSMVDRRERTRLFDVYEDVIVSFGLPILLSRLPVRSKFSKELETGNNGIYRSTLLAPDPAFIRDCQLDKLADEILSIIKLNRHGS